MIRRPVRALAVVAGIGVALLAMRALAPDGRPWGEDAERDPAEAMNFDAALGGGLSYPFYTDWWRAQSCASLFSKQPPPELAGATWWPVCSPTHVFQARANFPRDRAARLVHRLGAAMHDLDDCAKGAGSLRGSGEYVPPSQADEGLRPMSDRERADYERLFIRQRERVGRACCGGLAGRPRADCDQVMRGVSLEWCRAQAGPDEPDRCIWGANFDMSEREAALLDQFLHANPAPDRLPVSVGRILIGPFINEWEVPADDPTVLTHELGHACSHARKLASARAGDSAAYREFVSAWRPGATAGHGVPEGCDLSPDALRTYSTLFRDFGASAQTWGCLRDVAEKSVFARFRRGGCEDACPREVLEESFADLVALWHSPPEWEASLIEGQCRNSRDNHHPLGADQLACELETPSLRAHIARTLGCQSN